MAGRLGRKVYNRQRWRRVRLEVLSRDGYRCTRCGRAGRLTVHHLDPVAVSEGKADPFDPSRLRSLCAGCHIILHLPRQAPDLKAWRKRMERLSEAE